jgi:2-haloacid dehalogenase
VHVAGDAPQPAGRRRPGRVLSVEAVGAYKPDPRVYAHAVEAVGAQWLVAAHWWDVGGAKRAGLRTAWVGEDEARLLATVPEPDIRAPDLLAAARALLEA